MENAQELQELIIGCLSDDKASDIAVIDLQGKSELADSIIIATGRVNKHIEAMAEKLSNKLAQAGYGDISPQGDAKSCWMIIDAFDVIVHLFTQNVRQEYDLETLWGARGKLEMIEG
jgi:ribosome-associated protein